MIEKYLKEAPLCGILSLYTKEGAFYVYLSNIL